MKNKVVIENICKNCVYFEKFEIQKREDNVIGACKANPPLPGQLFNNGDSQLGVWPLVLGSFWCGIFSSINEE